MLADNGHWYRTLSRPGDGSRLRFFTWSCRNRLPLFGNPAIRDAYVGHLADVRAEGAYRLFSFVVMPSHVHLLLGIPDEKRVRHLLVSLKAPFSRDVLARWRQLEAPILQRLCDANGKLMFWQPGGGYDRSVLSPEGAREIIEYIHANPVAAGLTDRPEGWAWSSASAFAGLPSLISVDCLSDLI